MHYLLLGHPETHIKTWNVLTICEGQFDISQSLQNLVSLADVKMKNLEFGKENNSSCLVL